MTTIPSQWHVLFTLGRVSNLPTIWTNVLAAGLFTQATWNQTATAVQSPTLLYWLTLVVGMSLMYLGGMFLNDAQDAPWDQKYNIKRPVPLGYIQRNTVFTLSILLLLTGITLLYSLSMLQQVYFDGIIAVTVLLLAIVLYNLLHKQYVWSRFLMGVCRMSVYLIAGILIMGFSLTLVGVAILFGLYIAGITLLAQYEHTSAQTHQNKRIYLLVSILILFSAPIALLGIIPTNLPLFITMMGIALLLIHKLWPVLSALYHRTTYTVCPAQIGALLATIPLFDALILISVEQWLAGIVCIGIYCILPMLQRWITPT